MNVLRPKLRVFLDEGVPRAVGRVFNAHGHEVIYLDEAMKRGSADVLVCTVAQTNDAILVAFDNDMKQIARGHGVGGERFKKLSLIKFQCSEPNAAERLEQAMSLVEHEWNVSAEKTGRRLFVVIGKAVLRSHR